MKRGPIARPRVYTVKGRTAASREMEKACCMRELAGTVMEDANVLGSTSSVNLTAIESVGLHLEGKE